MQRIVFPQLAGRTERTPVPARLHIREAGFHGLPSDRVLDRASVTDVVLGDCPSAPAIKIAVNERA